MRFITANTKRCIQSREFILYLVLGVALSIFATWGSLQAGIVHASKSIDVSNYDNVLRPLIDADHLPPVIMKEGESFNLEFVLSCNYIEANPRCQPDAKLFLSDAPRKPFVDIPLTVTNNDALRVHQANITAPEKGGFLRYFLEIKDPEVNVMVRYPASGFIEVPVVAKFTQIELPTRPQNTPGEPILQMPWGKDERAAGLWTDSPLPIGPDAFDISADGRLALLDTVNQRVVEVNPALDKFQTYPVSVSGGGDLTYNADSSLMIADFAGISGNESKIRVPQLYRLGVDRKEAVLVGPIYARHPVLLSGHAYGIGKKVGVTEGDGRVLDILDSTGKIASRNDQQAKHIDSALSSRWLNDHMSRFYDPKTGRAFEITSAEALGAVNQFVDVPGGYVVIFETEVLRILWLNPDGNVLEDIVVPNEQYISFNPHGMTSVGPDGSVYYMSTRTDGLSVHRIERP